MYKTVFLDRDGTINEEVNYLHKEEDFNLLPGVAEAIRLWNDHGFRVVVVTNQAGVARGYYGEEDVVRLHRYMGELLKKQGARIDKCYYCPHHPEHGIGAYKIRCNCRKPKTGMFEEASREFPVDKAHSYMIGDKWSDLKAGNRFGLKTVLVGTGYGKELYEAYRKEKRKKENCLRENDLNENYGKENCRQEKAEDGEHPLDYFAKTLYDAALWVIDQENKGKE